ncbi:hypothetical protein GUJ93_ZPchr0026g29123 [Zizania palustris]|uniref:Uncharacterized protein n=1 Tax=Zizania palustris TaxID=103762 RepID=A0A8J5R006_ZIZPA|nr:hypothetical protein GUJ93_ZPchr0026g29123 [Zizania palustris]
MPTQGGVLTVSGDQAVVRRAEYGHGPPLDPWQVNGVLKHSEEASGSSDPSKAPSLKPSPEGDVITKMILKDGKEYPIQFSKGLPSEISTSLEELVKENLDIFAWTDEDIPVVDWSIIDHSLLINPKARPVRQGLRKL